MKRAFKWLALTLFVSTTIAAAGPASAQQAYSYSDLIKRLVDLEHLSVLPAPGETSKQWSSYDRRSTFDEATGKYVKWDSNGDAGGAIRTEPDGTVVFAEMEGPGCVWRFWTATAENEHVQIFLDGQEVPAVDLPTVNYFDGSTAPFNYPMLSYNLNKLGCAGYDLYFPIPYQKSCKIVGKKGWGSYYHFNYTTFPKGTTVPTFSTKLAADHAAELAKVNSYLQDKLGSDPAGERPGQKKIAQLVQLEAGKSQTIDIAGPQAITAVRAKFHDLTERQEQMDALRQLVLKITFDDGKPQVMCPLGDFFGSAPGYNLYKSLVTGMTADGAYALWYMPFAKSAKVELINEGKSPRKFDFELTHAPLTKPFEQLGHFHCKWHRDSFPTPAGRAPDWSLLRTNGRGRYCGTMLHVWNYIGGWWGEGDEKFFIDGEKMPSTFGTGSEDYFGYAWCNPNLFERPYHGQNMTQSNSGHQTLFRWQVVDNIPFQQSFDGYIEYYHGKPTEYAALVCWYLAPGGDDPYELKADVNRDSYYATFKRVKGGFEITGYPGGHLDTQDMKRFTNAENKWEDDNQMIWHAEWVGSKMEVLVNAPADGKYKLTGRFTKSSDYGIVQFSLDGKNIGQPFDGYGPGVTITPPIDLGTFDLKAGNHAFGTQMMGYNPKAYKSLIFGLDSLKLEPVK